ncbi:DUF1707 SHOCT-like domain-containing protein [Actinokineospora enzanensis]|uniref:DUF1707 SHOCT-like domain-containing protein n=1 Tax=Actinokineospora enzanensis TaxID=155975 RepID=UPI00035FA4F9|nr:DUF1707 domain-containing protein [Actinokineospora enzanensis]
MDQDNTPARRRILASTDERERVVAAVNQAVGEGRLTVAEADERTTAIYAVRYRDELLAHVSDLPDQLLRGLPGAPDPRPAPRAPMPYRRGVPTPLIVHAAIVAFVAVNIIARWAASPEPFFWPAFPLFWLVGSLIVHARIRRRRFQR